MQQDGARALRSAAAAQARGMQQPAHRAARDTFKRARLPA